MTALTPSDETYALVGKAFDAGLTFKEDKHQRPRPVEIVKPQMQTHYKVGLRRYHSIYSDKTDYLGSMVVPYYETCMHVSAAPEKPDAYVCGRSGGLPSSISIGRRHWHNVQKPTTEDCDVVAYLPPDVNLDFDYEPSGEPLHPISVDTAAEEIIDYYQRRGESYHYRQIPTKLLRQLEFAKKMANCGDQLPVEQPATIDSVDDAFARGVADGMQSGPLTSGITYPDPELNESYDKGVNAAQQMTSMRQACESVVAYVEGAADEDIASDADELTRCLRVLADKCHAALNNEPDEGKAKQRRVAIYRLPSGTASKGDFVGVYHGPVFEFSTPIYYEHSEFGASSTIDLQDQHYTAVKIDGRFWALRRAAAADLTGASHEVTIYPNTELDIDLVETPAKEAEKSPVEELVRETQQVLDDLDAEEDFQGRASIPPGCRTRLTELLNRVRKTL